jgi:hypothetical protein
MVVVIVIVVVVVVVVVVDCGPHTHERIFSGQGVYFE